jgi:hypothetical protein
MTLMEFLNYLNSDKPRGNENGQYKFNIQSGRVYDKILMTFTTLGEVKKTSSESVYCFVKKDTNDIYKPAGYNGRAKGARGNTYTLESTGLLRLVDVYGTWLYA